MIGVFGDSHGDLDAFERAYELLRTKGARRYVFLGGRYTDLDEWILSRKQRARGHRAYDDRDFLSDIASFLASQDSVDRASVRGEEAEDPARLAERFVRVPDRECLQYRDAQIPKKVVDMLGQTLCCVVHEKNDLTREDLVNASVFIHGKEPEARVVQIGPRFFVSPGQLTGAAEQTCGLIVLAEGQLTFSAFTLEGEVRIDAQPLPNSQRSKVSVE